MNPVTFEGVGSVAQPAPYPPKDIVESIEDSERTLAIAGERSEPANRETHNDLMPTMTHEVWMRFFIVGLTTHNEKCFPCLSQIPLLLPVVKAPQELGGRIHKIRWAMGCLDERYVASKPTILRDPSALKGLRRGPSSSKLFIVPIEVQGMFLVSKDLKVSEPIVCMCPCWGLQADLAIAERDVERPSVIEAWSHELAGAGDQQVPIRLPEVFGGADSVSVANESEGNH